jgi:hypothetical protein
MQSLQPYMSTITMALLALGAVVLVLLLYKLLSTRMNASRGLRLGVTEYYDIDKSRRLLIIRRDEVEHLVMIGGPQDLVIEQNIEGGLMSAPSITRSEELAFRSKLQDTIQQSESNIAPLRPAPRPAVFGDRQPALRPIEPVVSLRRPERE